MFSVDYATLREILQQFLYTGIFRAYVAGSRLLPGEGYIELQAKEGVIIACQFVTKQGSAYMLDRWEERLPQLGSLNWELTPSTEVMPKKTLPLSETFVQSPPLSTIHSSTVAHHAISLHPSQIRQWPKLYRQVYALIDGRRQLSDIAFLLRRPQQEVAQIIDELSRQRLIELE